MKDNLKDIGIWGQRHYKYLKENRPTTVNVMRMKTDIPLIFIERRTMIDG